MMIYSALVFEENNKKKQLIFNKTKLKTKNKKQKTNEKKIEIKNRNIKKKKPKFLYIKPLPHLIHHRERLGRGSSERHGEKKGVNNQEKQQTKVFEAKVERFGGVHEERKGKRGKRGGGGGGVLSLRRGECNENLRSRPFGWGCWSERGKEERKRGRENEKKREN